MAIPQHKAQLPANIGTKNNIVLTPHSKALQGKKELMSPKQETLRKTREVVIPSTSYESSALHNTST